MTDTTETFRSRLSGLWTPRSFDDPRHETYMLKRVTDIDVALRYARKTAVAVQAGGYIGMWPLRLAKTFSVVHTVEPLEANLNCLLRNCETVPGIVVHHSLLSSKLDAEVSFAVRKGWGSRIAEHDPNAERYEKRRTMTIDSLHLPCCDAIFLDIEGHELEALDGASTTIRQFRPVITLEAWDDHVEKYKQFMHGLDYEFVSKVHMDMIFRPR